MPSLLCNSARHSDFIYCNNRSVWGWGEIQTESRRRPSPRLDYAIHACIKTQCITASSGIANRIVQCRCCRRTNDRYTLRVTGATVAEYYGARASVTPGGTRQYNINSTRLVYTRAHGRARTGAHAPAPGGIIDETRRPLHVGRPAAEARGRGAWPSRWAAPAATTGRARVAADRHEATADRHRR